jgi:hypothetical protein
VEEPPENDEPVKTTMIYPPRLSNSAMEASILNISLPVDVLESIF